MSSAGADRPAPLSQPAAVTQAIRAAARFDHRMISPSAGLLAAIPVVLVLGIGIAIGKPVWGVTMGAGAMLVGTAWRVTGGRPPLAVMALDALVMATATFLGCITGSVAWLHILMLCAWSALGGLLVGVGNRGGVIGTQAIIAAVVFGRFSEPAPQALGLAALVLVGGLTQVLFLTVIRWPLPLRGQRDATAGAYRSLAELAAGPDGASTLPAAAALDDADAALASPTMFGDAAIMTLRSLVSEGFRLRIQIMAIHALRLRLRGSGQHPEVADLAGETLDLTADMLAAAADAVQAEPGADVRLAEHAEGLTALSRSARATAEAGAAPATDEADALVMARRLAALTGQVRAIASLAPAAGKAGGLRTRRPYRPTSRPTARMHAHAEQLRANMSLQSPAGRHAARLAVVVPVATVIARELPVSRGYWVAVAAATVLRPEFGATFTRGTERALGTCLGVALAGAISVALHPAGGVIVVIVGLLGWAGYAMFPASFAVGFAFITTLVVFLLNALSPDTLSTASARLLDTLIGGALGLVAYALWPTWAHGTAWQKLAELVDAQRAYISSVLSAAAEGRRVRDEETRTLARRARLARTAAEATVARSLSEPSTRRIDATESQAALGALRRLVQAAHVVRLDTQEERARHPLPELAPLTTGIARLLELVAETLRGRPAEPDPGLAAELPDLRALYGPVERAHAGDPEALPLLAELDELVDAANGLAAAVGLEDVDDARPGRRVLQNAGHDDIS